MPSAKKRSAKTPEETVSTGLRLSDLLEAETPLGTAKGLPPATASDILSQQRRNQILTNLESEPSGSPARFGSLVDAFQAFSGNRFANAQEQASEAGKKRKLARALLANQFMGKLSGLPEEVRQGFLPEDLRFVKGSSIPQPLYESIGKPEFQSNLSAFIKANPNAKREDILALISQDRSAKRFAGTQQRTQAAETRRAENPLDRRFNNAVAFLEKQNGRPLSAPDRAALARQLAVGSDSTVGLETEAPVQAEPMREQEPEVDTGDPLTRLQGKYGLKF